MKIVTIVSDLLKMFLNSRYAAEGQGATMIIALGIWLMLGYEFSLPTYRVMASLASETSWGILFLIVGAVQLYALLYCSMRFRRYMLLMKGALWITLCVTVTYGNWRALSVPIYLVFAISAFRAFLVFGRARFESEDT